ncbi:MAG: hypothetical protein EOP48_27020, partial [Sphingobacteriales bacterium]
MKSPVIYEIHRVDVLIVGANLAPQILTEGESSEYFNFYAANLSAAGATGIHHYSKITYKNIYDNIDLEFVNTEDTGSTFKYNFIVHPGGDIADIQLKYDGAMASLSGSGNIQIETSLGQFEESIPVSYIKESGKLLSVKYKKISEGVFGFFCNDPLRKDETLVVDPWATYFGGIVQEFASDITTDNFNNVIVSGESQSINNIATANAFQTTLQGDYDAFVAKYNSAGSLLWASYYGGNNFDNSTGMESDFWGNIVIGGITSSTAGLSTTGSAQPIISGIENGFIAKFNSSGFRIWCTYFGGDNNGVTDIEDVGIDNAGNVFAAIQGKF